jgi:transcription initiation factor TFIIIB Brf1 subunit/transcription initiation factor TFIIB
MKDLSVDIECPNCGQRTTINVRDMVPGRSKNCAQCGAVIEFSGDDARGVQGALDDLEDQLKRGSQEFTLKL